jgi:serine/threonine protein kinase/tetratricopeptide (TPR) repeat protein
MTISCDAFKNYKILEVLGKGGMGEVYLAEDTKLERKVAIKVLLEDIQEDDTAKQRFHREAKAAASLDHPFICKVYETGECDGKDYMVMEYVEGDTLKERLEEGPIPLPETMRIMLEMTEALEKAHGKGIVHRDLKPVNIMLTKQGHVKVMDFGLAKHVLPMGMGDITRTIAQDTITQAGTIAGTLAYMSPEQAKAKPVDSRSDIFTMGLIFYEMLTGRHPFLKSTQIETLTSILHDPTPPPHMKPKAVNPIVTPVMRKCLAKKPKDRYQETSELVADLHKIRSKVVGPQLSFKKVAPIAAAGLIVVTLGVYSLLHFTRPTGAPGEETGPAPISVLITDFQNQSGETMFDGAVDSALQLVLQDSTFISIFGHDQASGIAEELKPGSSGTLDEEAALLVGRSQGINVVVCPSVETKDGGFTLTFKALDVANAKVLFEESRDFGSTSEILKASDRLAKQLRSDLGGIPADSQESLDRETFTTSSLEALQAYANGQQLEGAGDKDGAIKEFLRALDHDPDLGRAYAGLGALYYNQNQIDQAETYYQEALKRLHQMTNREKYRTRGGYYLMTQNYKKAIEEYSALKEEYPRDAVANQNLATSYFFAYRMKDAYDLAATTLDANPGNINAIYNLSWFGMGIGDFVRGEEAANETLKIYTSFDMAFVVKALNQLAQEKNQEAVTTYVELQGLSDKGASLATAGLADFAVYEGRLKDAEKMLTAQVPIDIENRLVDLAAEKWAILARVYWEQGEKQKALDASDQAIALASESKQGERFYAASEIYIKAGATDKARDLAARLVRKPQPVNQMYGKLITGYMSLERGDPVNATTLFEEAQALNDTWLGRFALGLCYLELESYAEAYTEFDTCLNRRGEAMAVFLNDWPSFRYLDTLHYYLGRAQEGIGSPAAKESYRKFLDIKANTDSDSVLTNDATQRLSNLEP